MLQKEFHSNSKDSSTPNTDSTGNDKSLKCKVKARIPFGPPSIMSTADDTDNLQLYVYLYDFYRSSSADRKPEQHLALVYNKPLYSSSLEQTQQDDTEHGRTVRGASLSSDTKYHIPSQASLTRIHSACFTGETLHSLRCDCGTQLENAMLSIIEEGFGIILYLQQEGRGIGLEDKLKAYNLQDIGYDTYEANQELGHPPDARDYEVAAMILNDLSIE
jgi:GTP cyclohydrolase II